MTLTTALRYLFAGFHRSELRNYEYMPAYPLLVAASFRFLGLGVVEARLVSVACGWLTVLLTYQLGRRLYGAAVGLTAAALLCTLRLGLLPHTSGIPLLDFSRLIRYDLLVPVGVLGAAICFVWAASRDAAEARGSRLAFVLAGALAGLATMAHLYGAFILVVCAVTLLWQRRLRLFREPPLYLLAAGWLLAVSPWIAYVFQDVDAYVGQMSRHVGRFDLLALGALTRNLTEEPWRYAPWLRGGFPDTFLLPRAGIWLLILGVPAGMTYLARRTRRGGTVGDRFLLVSVPVLALCLGLLVTLKRHIYTLLLLPFLMLMVALAIVSAWRSARERRAWQAGLLVVGGLIILEGGMGVAGALTAARRASPYLQLCAEIAAPLPAGARLLISQPYWLGLEALGDFELRSVNLVFQYQESMTVAEAMARLEPDYVVIERFFLQPQPGDPRGPPVGSEAAQVFLRLGAYLKRACPDIRSHDDPVYGTVEVYRCR